MTAAFNRVKESRWTMIMLPLVLLAGIGIVFTVMTGGNFLTTRNMKVIMQQSMIVGTVATGAMFIFATGNVNLAMGSCTALTATVAAIAYNATGSLGIMFAVAIGLGVLIMLFCVVLSTSLHVMVIHVTIVMMTLLSAIQSEIVGGASISLPYKMTSAANSANVPLMIFAGFVLFSILLFHLTPVGRYIKMVGANTQAAELTGMARSKALTIAFLMAGIGAGLAGLLLIFRTGSISNTTGGSINMDVMLAIVLGGMPVYGGSKSKAYAPIIGAITVTALNNGLLMIGVSASFLQGVRGVIFLLLLLIGNKRPVLLPANEG
ncbi:MAG: ABC transporter permease [Clostridiales bacterium]|nr:ABC transporter permease [Clostridiales bacterium]